METPPYSCQGYKSLAYRAWLASLWLVSLTHPLTVSCFQAKQSFLKPSDVSQAQPLTSIVSRFLAQLAVGPSVILFPSLALFALF